MKRPSPFRIPLVVVVLILGAAEARAHIPPLAYLSMTMDDVELVQTMTIRADLFTDWTGESVEPYRPPEGQGSVEIGDAARAMLAKAHATWMAVTVDGVEVEGIVRDALAYEIFDHQYEYEYLNLTVAYGVKGKVKQVGFLWRRFENTLDTAVAPIDVELDARGIMDYSAFSERDPGWVWHAPLEKSERGKTLALPPVPVPATVEFSVLSVVLALAAFVAIPVVLVRRVRPLPAAAAILAPLVVAAGLWGVSRTELELPWKAGFSMPDEPQAAALFESLHRNIYRAFDYTTEDAIYDTLARTVEGDLLDDVYAEVYQSLILRDQGGAVCVVRGTEILETDVAIPDDTEAREFDVTCRWRVKGTVEHYGHRHVRMNEYRARYTVRWRDGGWKISEARTLGQKRVAVDD